MSWRPNVVNAAGRAEPTYPITSVGNALRLLLLFRERKAIRLSDASDYLGVANSTAHRLLAMLVHHEFVEQDPGQRTYIARLWWRSGWRPYEGWTFGPVPVRFWRSWPPAPARPRCCRGSRGTPWSAWTASRARRPYEWPPMPN
ncbi:MAG: helix-turn-helix domain-containing protein [Geodermatophilaceae bacterium]|nr:helix-turn-helix domain-containing protein [Geodermatophilaceae bacterium]